MATSEEEQVHSVVVRDSEVVVDGLCKAKATEHTGQDAGGLCPRYWGAVPKEARRKAATEPCPSPRLRCYDSLSLMTNALTDPKKFRCSSSHSPFIHGNALCLVGQDEPLELQWFFGGYLDQIAGREVKRSSAQSRLPLCTLLGRVSVQKTEVWRISLACRTNRRGLEVPIPKTPVHFVDK